MLFSRSTLIHIGAIALLATTACGGHKSSPGGGSTPTSPTTPAEPTAPADPPGAPIPPPTTCTYAATINPDDLERDGGNATLAITTAAGCKWTVKGDAAWAVVEGPVQGEGGAQLKVFVQSNEDAAARRMTFSVADRSVTLTQPGQGDCGYSVSPVDSFIPRLAWSGQIAVSTARGCAWTVSSDSAWVRPRQTSGHGPATVPFDADFNPETRYAEKRSGILAFRWLAPTAGQNVRVMQSGDCNVGMYAATGGLAPGSTYEFSTSGGTLTAGAQGGQFHFWIQTDPYTGCAWALQGGDSWVDLISPRVGQIMPGDGDLHFTLPANPLPQTRRTALLMDNKPLTIVQQGR